MKKYFYIMSLIVLPVVAATFVYMKNLKEDPYYWLPLSGESKHWKVEKGSIIATKINSFQEGKLVYKGDVNDINSKGNEIGSQITVLSFKKRPNKSYNQYIKELKHYSRLDALDYDDIDIFNDKNISSYDGPPSFEIEEPYNIFMDNYNEDQKGFVVGSGTISINDEEINIEDITKRFYMVHWKTKDGKEYTENISLDIDNGSETGKVFWDSIMAEKKLDDAKREKKIEALLSNLGL